MHLSPPKVKTELVPLADIIADQANNPREGGTCEGLAKEYADEMDKGSEEEAAFFEKPPVVYCDRQGAYHLSQGFKRFRAFQLRGKYGMPCEVRQGDRKAAALDAAASNQRHGERRSTADKRRAIAIVVREEPTWNASKVARHCGVDDKTVASVREELQRRSEIPTVTAYVDSLGRTQPAKQDHGGRTPEPSPPREKLPAVAPPPDDDEIPPPDPKFDFEADVDVVCVKLAECRLGVEECRAEIERLGYTAFGASIGHKKALALLDAIDLEEVARLVWASRKGEPPTG